MKKYLRWLWLAIQNKREYKIEGAFFMELRPVVGKNLSVMPALGEFGLHSKLTILISPRSLPSPCMRIDLWKVDDDEVLFGEMRWAVYTLQGDTRKPITLCTKGLRKRFFHVPRRLYIKVLS